jgi:hypothetical protein
VELLVAEDTGIAGSPQPDQQVQAAVERGDPLRVSAAGTSGSATVTAIEVPSAMEVLSAGF